MENFFAATAERWWLPKAVRARRADNIIIINALPAREIKVNVKEQRKQAIQEDLVFEKTVDYILSPDIIDTIARSVTDNFNQGLEKSNALILFEKELANVEQALNGFLSAIAAGIVTKSTKERMLSLEGEKEELETKSSWKSNGIYRR